MAGNAADTTERKRDNMHTTTMKARSIRSALLAGAALGVIALPAAVSAPAAAQDAPAALEEIIITGSRIARPNLNAASPIYSLGEAEIDVFQQPEVEKIFRILPVTIPGDGQNVNNGTAGVSTINLRGLGAARNLIMIDGKRVTPYNIDGLVDVSQVPTALIERVDIVTGGASAVYGSDAISGAINFILKRDFEGVDASYDFSMTGEGDGQIHSGAVTLGSNVDGGRGNAVVSLNYSKRKGVQLGKRPLGNLGIETASGANLEEFLAGQQPAPAPDGCGGPNSVAAGGSTTTLPTRVAIAGGPGLGQFRDDGTLGSNCSVFNFNPYNYYQTPQERFGTSALAHYEINEHVEAYVRANYTSTNVRQQVAPSGIFGSSYFVPLANPFLSDQARQFIINAANAGVAAGTVNTAGAFPNWRDLNGNGVVDVADDLNIQVRRRTVEFGERSTTYDNNTFQFVVGARGDIMADWSYDVAVQYGESDRTNVSSGYTNVTNFGNALNAISTTECRGGQPGCVPINVFGGFGSITADAAAYSAATAIEKQSYSQFIVSGVVSGPLTFLQSPFASESVSLALGTEYREEEGETTPDECWKLAPASCLGGAGGNILPVKGGFNVSEFFAELIVPIASGMPGIEVLDLETAYRYSDYDKTGGDHTWKVGLTYAPISDVRLRAAVQRAARAPNVGELAAPQTATLDNASLDPCSIANAAALAGNATLRERCVATGMSAAQVGTIEDIVSGQVNTFSGTDFANLPEPEQADTLTVGVVLTPDFGGPINDVVISLDYYDIDIKDYIGTFTPQEVLDGCYTLGIQGFCDTVRRVGGTLTLPGSGIELFETNLDYFRAEGVELGTSFRLDLEDLGADASMGSLAFSLNANWYLTHESQSSSTAPVIDCKGRYSASCNPLPDFRFVQRTTWSFGDFEIGYLWRHIGEISIPPELAGAYFDDFESIEAYNYIDLNASWQVVENLRISASVTNLFEEDPPIVGNEAGTTAFNSGNTFPSLYDTLGRVFTVGFDARF